MKRLNTLPEEHDSYFDLSGQQHEMIPLSKLTPTKDRVSETRSIASAKILMGKARRGENPKRAPISVRREGDGYHITDGNATFHAATDSNWKEIPCIVEKAAQSDTGVSGMPPGRFADRPVAAIHGPVKAPDTPSAHQTPQERHKATGPNATEFFTHEEMSLPPKTYQKTKHLEGLMEEAKNHKEWLDNTIDRGKGLSAQLGLHVVEGRTPTKEDYEEAHKKGGMVHLAPLKGTKDGGARIKEKASSVKNQNEDGTPGFHRLRDLSRASIAVPHKDDIPHIVEHLRRAGVKFAERPEERFSKPTEEGYSDVQTSPVDPHGHIGELQLHTLDMYHAKERGHQLFKEIRKIPRDALGKPTNEADADKLEALREESKHVYQAAREKMDKRKPAHHKGVRVTVEKAVTKKAPKVGARFYRWDHHPTVLLSNRHFPLVYNGKTFVVSDELAQFHHEAVRIDEHEFKKLVANFHKNRG